MRTRVYLKDWFFNSGIVGFINILKANDDDFTEKHENYIEFDLENLKNFHKYYFKYFFDTYNIANTVNTRIDQSFNRISNYIKNINDKEKLKNEKKYIKSIIKKQLDKIKKIDDNTYNIILENYNNIDKIQSEEELPDLQQNVNNIKLQIEKDNINKRLTMNLFKNILSQNYFGQPSFLNVGKTSLTFEEQEELMYKDYISCIIETIFLKEILSEKYGLEELSNILDKKIEDKKINDDVKKIYSNIIKKYIQKGKNIEEIKEYIEKNVLETCFMCEDDMAVTTNYTESNFTPLAISSENMKNFFWNQNANFPICSLCKLILFCSPAGISNIEKTVKENEQGKIVYRKKDLLGFVNYDTNIETLYKTNMDFKKRSNRNTENNPYAELVLDIVSQKQKISEWQLENIFVVEFESEYGAYSRMEYFNIKRYIAEFFISYAKYSLDKINDYGLKVQIIDYMLKNKDIRNITSDRLISELRKENRFSYNYYLTTIIKTNLNILKKGGKNMNDQIEKANNKLYVMYRLGNEIYEQLQNENNENKLDSYIYKMLNCIKENKKNEFIDIAIRVIWSSGKDIPQFLVKLNEEVEWQELGHSFVSGLTRSKYVKEEKNNG